MIRGSITNPTEDEILKGKLPGNINYGIQGPPGPKGSEGGYYIPAVTQMDENTIQFTFEPSKTDMPVVDPTTVELPASQGSGGNVEDGFSPIAADWNAAEGEPGHILNRTHYEETVSVNNVIMVETEVITTANSTSGLNMKSVSSVNTFSEEQFVPGDTYIVEYDGMPYTCVAGVYKNGYLGNPVLHQLGINGTLAEDNRFPFCLIRPTEKLVNVGTSEPGTHTFKVIHVENETVVHKLDSKFIPPSDWNAAEGEPGHILNRTHYEYVGKVVEEVTINAASFDTVITAAHPIVVGETYTVHWGEDTYICEAWDGSVVNPAAAGMPGLGDYGVMMDGPVTGEPFLIVFTGNAGQVIGFGEDMEISFSIDGSVAVKIPDKYLPDTMKYALLEITEEEFATASNSNEYTITLNRNISHYVSIFENGGTVLVKIPFDEGVSISPVVCCVKLQGGFTQMFLVRAFDGIKVREYLIRIAAE